MAFGKTVAVTVALSLFMPGAMAIASTTKKETLESEQRAAPSTLLQDLQIVGERSAAFDYAGTCRALEAVLANRDFSTLPLATQKRIISFLGIAETRVGEWPAAYDHLIAGGPTADAALDGEYYLSLSGAAQHTGRPGEALDALITLTELVPNSVSQMDLGYVMNTSRYAASLDDGGKKEKQFLEGLWSAHYQAPDTYQNSDYLWFHLFELDVAAGQDDKAREVMAAFREPESVIWVRSDNRYARFLSDSPTAGDFQARVNVSTANARNLMTAHPDSVEAIANLAYRLAAANHLDEALKLTDDALARVAAAPKDKPAFGDEGDKLAWIDMTRSLILQRQNHLDQQVKTQEDALKSAAAGTDLVSQNINLGFTYAAHGQPQEALDVVANVDANSSAYGVMAADEVRVCAYKQLGDKAKLAETVAYMKAHIADGYNPYRHALLCSGDVDALAASMVMRLDNPKTRNDTLYWMQTYLPQPLTPLAQQWQQVEIDAMTRPEVKAAVARYGRVDAYPTYEALE